MEAVVALIIILGALAYIVTRSMILWSVREARKDKERTTGKRSAPPSLTHGDIDERQKVKGDQDGLDKSHG
jgi:hypothetical protein